MADDIFGAAVSDDGASNTKLPDNKKKKGLTKAQKTLRRRLITAAVVLAAAGGLGYYGKTRFDAAKTAKEAESAPKTTAVTTSEITQKISSTGTIAAKDTYSITSLVSGTIVEADFQEGDQVKKGQVLYRIDNSSMNSELTSAENSLRRAENSLSDAQNELGEAQSKYGRGYYASTMAGFVTEVHIVAGEKIGSNTSLVDLTDETVMEIRVPFLVAEAEQMLIGMPGTIVLSDTMEQVIGNIIAIGAQDVVLEGGRIVRYVTLDVPNPGGLASGMYAHASIAGMNSVEEGSFEAKYTVTMKADLDQSMDCTSVLVHEGDFLAVGSPVFTYSSKSVSDALKSYSDAVDNKESSVESAQQKLDSTSENIDNYTITAPIDGQVITKTYKVGDKIGNSSSSSSDKVLCVIYDMSAYTFEMSIDETEISEVAVGQRVEVTADAFEGEEFSGVVTNISLQSSVSNGVSTYPVVVTMDSTERLLPGMNVDAEIVIASEENALVVPADALMRGNRVYVKDESVTEASGSVPAGFRSVEVTTGLVNDEMVQILSGVSEGDEVYISDSSAAITTMMMPGMGGMGGMGGAPGGGGGGGGSRSGGGGNRGGGGGR